MLTENQRKDVNVDNKEKRAKDTAFRHPEGDSSFVIELEYLN